MTQEQTEQKSEDKAEVPQAQEEIKTEN